MSVEMTVRMDKETMGDFMVHHIYAGGLGMIILVLGALNVGFGLVFLMKGKVALAALFVLLAGLVFLAFPWLIRSRVSKQMKQRPHLSDPVRYIFQEDGVETITEAESGKASWKKFKRVVWKGRVLILYAEGAKAILLPIEQIKGQLPEIIELLQRKLPPSEIKIPPSRLAALKKNG